MDEMMENRNMIGEKMTPKKAIIIKCANRTEHFAHVLKTDEDWSWGNGAIEVRYYAVDGNKIERYFPMSDVNGWMVIEGDFNLEEILREEGINIPSSG